MSISSVMRERVFNKSKQLMMSNFTTIAKDCNLYNISTLVSPIYNFSLAGNINVYTPIQGRNKEKYNKHIIYERKMPLMVGNKHLSVHFFFHRQLLFHLSTEKCAGIIRQVWTSKWLFPRRHNKY